MHKIIFYSLLLLPLVSIAQNDKSFDKELERERKKELKEFAKSADTSYYISYHSDITARLYLSRKSTSLSINNAVLHNALTYRPNSSLNLGIGASYKWITLNIAYGFGFLNFLNPKEELGKTKYLDLQGHIYGRKLVVDVFGQFYKGFYLSPRGTASVNDSYYLRDDIRVNQVGLSMQYVVNNRQFSYRASFLQNEWQKKSAGTVLIGFESYIGNVRADSTIIPNAFDSAMAGSNIREFRYYKTGPNVGCAYTFVYKKHFFLTGSVAGNLGIGNNTIISDKGRDQNFGVSTSIFIRAFAGYNSNKWAISAMYISNNIGVNPGDISSRIALNISNIRLNFVYRFPPPKRVKKQLDVLDKTEKYIKEKIDYDKLK